MPDIGEKYFSKFPQIKYSNTSVVDITKRTAITKLVSSNPYAFYPYDISNAERADYLSYRYYGDSYFSWLIYHTNEIIDPYYQWYLSYDDFNEFITKKYGSIENSHRKVHHYQNNWENNDNISVEDYNALTDGQKNYWDPIYKNKDTVKEYYRKEIDWVSNTNKIISFTVSGSNNFIQDEVCDIVFDPLNTGKGQVTVVSNNEVYIHHVSGTYYTSDTVSINANSYIYGTESSTNSIFTGVSASANNIAEEEIVYWKEITNYEYEYMKNEFNRTLRIMDDSYKEQVAEELDNLLDS